jgi:hypothetical protein
MMEQPKPLRAARNRFEGPTFKKEFQARSVNRWADEGFIALRNLFLDSLARFGPGTEAGTSAQPGARIL